MPLFPMVHHEPGSRQMLSGEFPGMDGLESCESLRVAWGVVTYARNCSQLVGGIEGFRL